MRSIQNQSNSAIQHLVDRVITAGAMTRQEHLSLTSILLAEQRITDDDRHRINRIFDYIQTGRLKLID